MRVSKGLSGLRGWLTAVVLVTAAGGAQAQTLDFGSCVRIEDLSARLACYDRAAGRQPGAAMAPAAAPAAAAPAIAPAPPRAAVPAAVAPVPPAPVNPVAAFGASERGDPLTAKRATAPPPEEVKQIEAKVTAVRSRPKGEQVLTLDNGQVWEQTEFRAEPQFKIGDTVVIRRAMLGSFILTLEKGSPSTRARRIS